MARCSHESQSRIDGADRCEHLYRRGDASARGERGLRFLRSFPLHPPGRLPRSYQPPPPPLAPDAQLLATPSLPGHLGSPLRVPSTPGRGPPPGAGARPRPHPAARHLVDAPPASPQVPSRRRRAVIHGEASPGGTRALIHAIQHPPLKITSSSSRRRRRSRSFPRPLLVLLPAGAGPAASASARGEPVRRAPHL